MRKKEREREKEKEKGREREREKLNGNKKAAGQTGPGKSLPAAQLCISPCVTASALVFR